MSLLIKIKEKTLEVIILKNSPTFTLLKQTIKKNLHYLFFLFILSVIVAINTSINPIIFQIIIDDTIPHKDLTKTIICILIICVTPIFNTLLNITKNKIGYKFTDICSKKLRQTCFDKTLYMNFSTFDNIGPQKLMNIITRSVGRITELYIYGDLVNFITNIVQFSVIIFVLYNYDIRISLFSLISIPLLLILLKCFNQKISKYEKAFIDNLMNGEKLLLQCFYGMKTVRSYSGQENEYSDFNKWLIKNSSLGWKTKNIHNFTRTVIPNFISQIVLGCLFIIAALLIINDKLTIGILVAIVTYVPLMISSINSLLSINIGKTAIVKITEDIDLILKAEQESKTTSSFLFQKNKPLLSLENINFSYERDGFSLNIPKLALNKGDFFIIVGGSGGGKSSIIDILNKFYSIESGDIYFNGVNFSEISPNVIRNSISTIFQDTFLFNKNIQENISYPYKTEDNINLFSEKAQLTNFINTLPEKENTIINDFGENLSGGERQRICLARALFKNADILLFDEPTSALDSITSKKIFEMLKKEQINNGKTIILITHDIGKITYASKVAVINDGKLEEIGTPDELLNNNGLLKQMYSAQQNKTEEG